jgi:ribosomal protein S18 acetylase RimI-like enzyme
MLIRPATAADLPDLCELLGQLFEQEADFHPDTRKQERALRAILDQPEVGSLFVATLSGRITGMVNLLFSISTAEGGPVAWLDDMVVHRDFRGQGIGPALLRTGQAHAREQGCLRITLHTDDDNHAAQGIYEKAGFVRSGMQVWRWYATDRTSE